MRKYKRGMKTASEMHYRSTTKAVWNEEMTRGWESKIKDGWKYHQKCPNPSFLVQLTKMNQVMKRIIPLHESCSAWAHEVRALSRSRWRRPPYSRTLSGTLCCRRPHPQRSSPCWRLPVWRLIDCWRPAPRFAFSHWLQVKCLSRLPLELLIDFLVMLWSPIWLTLDFSLVPTQYNMTYDRA